jgi:hypothetical protein
MFCQPGECNTNYPQSCNKTHTSNNLLPQYHIQYPTIQNPTIQNPKQNTTANHNQEKSTSTPKYIYTKLGTYPIQQILDNKEIIRKYSHQIQKKKINTFVNGYFPTIPHTLGGSPKINYFLIIKTILSHNTT